MDPGRLCYFQAAADKLSFGPAVTMIGVGQPVIFRQIAALGPSISIGAESARFTARTSGPSSKGTLQSIG